MAQRVTTGLFSLATLAPMLPAQADAARVFTDIHAFVGALTSTTAKIDFESTPFGFVVGDPWLDEGVVFDQADVGDNMVVSNGGGVDRNIHAGGGEAADIEITLTQRVNGFGLDVFSNNVASEQERLVFYGSGGAVLADVPMPQTDTQTSRFVGVVAAEAIARVAFIEGDDDSDFAGIGAVIAGRQVDPHSLAYFAPIGLRLAGTEVQLEGLAGPGLPRRSPIVLAAATATGSHPLGDGLAWSLAHPLPLATLWPDRSGVARWTPPQLDGPAQTLHLQAWDPISRRLSNTVVLSLPSSAAAHPEPTPGLRN